MKEDKVDNRDDAKKSESKRNPGQLSKQQIKSLLEAMNQHVFLTLNSFLIISLYTFN